MLKSIFERDVKTVFISYPSYCNEIRKNDREDQENESLIPKYKILESSHPYNCVVNSLINAGFEETEGKNWNLLWSAPLNPESLKKLNKYQRCNHFPLTWQL